MQVRVLHGVREKGNHPVGVVSFFFWCSRITPSDRAKRSLYCDRPLVVLVIVLPDLHTATRLSAIKISLLVAADARNVTPKVVNIWRGAGDSCTPAT